MEEYETSHGKHHKRNFQVLFSERASRCCQVWLLRAFNSLRRRKYFRMIFRPINVSIAADKLLSNCTLYRFTLDTIDNVSLSAQHRPTSSKSSQAASTGSMWLVSHGGSRARKRRKQKEITMKVIDDQYASYHPQIFTNSTKRKLFLNFHWVLEIREKN